MFDIKLKEYNKITDEIATIFCKKYFKTDDYYWVADDCIDGPLYINDMFFSLEDMLNYMKYKYNFGQLTRYYYYTLDCAENGENPICIRDWKRLK